MGTNYYTKTTTCAACNHKPEGIHLGKYSCGWQFTFQYNGGKYYKNIKEMKKWLKDKRIVNEYGEDVTNKEFWAMIEKMKNGLSHYDYVKNKQSEFFGEHELLIDGYSFINTEFS